MSSTTPQPTGRKNARMRQTVGDMVRSLVVVLAFVAIILVITLRPQPDPIKRVEVNPILTVARAQAGFPVYVAGAGTSEYVPTSVRWEPTEATAPDPVWHIGYVTPEEEYVEISESASASERFIPERTGKGAPLDPVVIDGVTWQRFESDQRRSLVRVEPSLTTVVAGTLDWAGLQSVAAGLSASATA
ncbi:MAG: DUF4245 domain-containing protein [Actinomycetes bacterium]